MSMTGVSVFGLGYVGCVSAACFAEEKFLVTGVDVSKSKVDMINAGKATIVENGIQELVGAMVAEKRLRATTDVVEAVKASTISLVCVGTPSRPNGSIDLTYIERVCEQIGAAIALKNEHHVVVIRSTVLPGTIEGTVIPALERGRGDIVHRNIHDSWSSFAGRAIEPLVRGAVAALLPDPRFGDAEFVGAFWNRDNSVEIDLVGGRALPTSEQIDFVGSIKWRERGDFDRGDISTLIQHRALVPGATDDTLLLGVSRNGFTVDGLDIRLTAEDIVAATA